VIGSDHIICDRFQAAYLSPSVVKALSMDPTINEFVLERTDSSLKELLAQLMCGDSVAIETGELSEIMSVCAILGNIELGEQLIEFVTTGDALTVSNCIDRFHQKKEFGLSSESELSFIASHFSEIALDSLQSLRFCDIAELLESENLCLESEDWLMNFLIDLGSDYFNPLGYVRLEFLKVDSIDRLFKPISSECVDNRLWSAIWRRCRYQLVYCADEIPKVRFKEVTPIAESPSCGLIHHLTDIYGGNVHERGVVEISCSSTQYNQCWQVVDYNWTSYWYSRSSANSWIQFDFKNREVFINRYALKPHNGTMNWPVQWTLAGSRDGTVWELIDSRNTRELVQGLDTKMFDCSNQSHEPRFYRYIRLTQTGHTSSGEHYFVLTNVEFFGSLIDRTKHSTSLDSLQERL
jgi:hypothetical protein